MKKIVLYLLFLCSALTTFSQNVGIGISNPHPSALLDITSTGKGLLIPRVTNTQRLSIPNPALGLMIFDSTAKKFMFYNGNDWENVGYAGYQPWASSGAKIFYNEGTVGIGTSNPAYSFTVVANGNGIVQQTADGTVKAGLFTRNSTNEAFFQTLTNTPLHLATNDGAAILTVHPNGNVGIGNSNPGTKLYVNGTSTFTGTSLFSGGLRIASGSPGSGKVLASDATGNASWTNMTDYFPRVGFCIRGIEGNGANVVAPNSFRKVHFAISNADYGSDYNNISGNPSSSFIVPVSGFYNFNSIVTISDFDGPVVEADYFTGIQIRIVALRNGSVIPLAREVIHAPKETDDVDIISAAVNTNIRVLAGDAVYVEILHTNTSNRNAVISGSNETIFFSGALLIKD